MKGKLSAVLTFAFFISRVLVYFAIVGSLVVDALTNTVLDKVDVRWWTLFLLAEIWFYTVVLKTLDKE
jgi:hypothetical protein